MLATAAAARVESDRWRACHRGLPPSLFDAQTEQISKSSAHGRSTAAHNASQTAIIEHLSAAIPFASDAMADALRALIAFYTSGSAADWRAYDIAWVKDKASPVDTINGFIEVYRDARAAKGT